MGLRFIIGRSGSGKSTLCLNEINEKQKLGKRLIYIVPEQYSLQAERELVAVSGGIVSAVVLSFRRLAENIFSEKGGLTGKHLSETGKLMILRRVLMKNKDNLKYFGIVCGRTGFVTKFSETVSNFAGSGISADDIRKCAEVFEKDSAVYQKLIDTALIYEQYCEFIKNEYISSDDVLSVAARKMSEAKYTSGAEVWLDGFYGFTGQEYDVIEKLLMSCENVNITLNMDKRSFLSDKMTIEDDFFEPWDTMRRLKKMCADKGINIEKTVFLTENRYNTDGLICLEKNYFKWKVNENNNSAGIKIMEADTIEDEINMCASEIIRLVRDKGIRYRDIALTARNLSDYEEYVKLIFSHYGIPFFMDSKRSVMGHPCTELIRAIIELTANNISYESMFRCLKTELTTVSRDDRDILENYVVKYGIKGSEWLEERWKRGFDNDETEEAENKINEIKDEAIKPFRDFYKKYKNGKHNIKNITVDLYGILENLEIAEKLGEKAEIAEVEGDIDKAQEQIRCFELIGELMENMASLLGDEDVTIKDYGEILEAGLSGLKMGIIPAAIDMVTIGDIERTRLPNIKALFTVGVNEGVLPAGNTEDSGIFSDRETETLEQNGLELTHSGARTAFEEQYLIYLGITKPSDYLYLCRSVRDGSGRETRQSPLITKIENMFSNVEKTSFRSGDITSVDRPIPVLHRLGEGLVKNNRIWQGAAEWLLNNEKYRNRAMMIKKGTELKNIEKNLSAKNLKRLYGGKMYTSISQLETFSSCPFCYFSRYSLKAKPRKVYEIRTPDLGSLYHAVLEKITEMMRDRGLKWQSIDENEIKGMIDEAIDVIVPDTANKVLLSTAAHVYMIKRIKRISARALSVLRKHMCGGKFETLGSEITFGSGELPAIEIKMPNGRELLLRGKIDRVDIYRKDGSCYVKIIDYKSGKKDFSLSDIYYGLQLQLLLYMDAFLKTGKILTEDEPDVGGVFYFRIMDPIINASELKENSPEAALYKQFRMTGLACSDADILEALDTALETGARSDIINISIRKDGNISGSAVGRSEYEKIMEFSADKAGELGQNILEGDVSINPVINGGIMTCDYCEYKSVCCFDPKNGNEARKLKHLSSDEVWDNILSGKK